MPTHTGSCHCKAITLTLVTPTRSTNDTLALASSTVTPASTNDPTTAASSAATNSVTLNACQCSFCRLHGALTYSNPEAHCTITINKRTHLVRYTFGLQTAEAILCRLCGAYMAMLLTDGGEMWATVNVRCLDDAKDWIEGTEVRTRDYDGEDAAQRTVRRKGAWCTASVVGLHME